jgi:dUTP pyrophosphatase
MRILNDKEIKEGIERGRLVEGFISLEHQLQPNGFDLTAAELARFEDRGSLDFSNKERVLPKTEPVKFSDMWAVLAPGVYKVKTNEYVRLPKDTIAFAQSRSSLLRMGAYTMHGFWDAGFEGKSEFLLVVGNANGMRVKQNARVAQIVFVKLANESEKGYAGIYHGMK